MRWRHETRLIDGPPIIAGARLAILGCPVRMEDHPEATRESPALWRGSAGATDD